MPHAEPIVSSIRKNRTTVRSLVPRLVQLAFRTAAQVAPSAAEKSAATLFFTPLHRRERAPHVEGLPRATHRIPFGDPGHAQRLRAWSWGAGPTVLLVHGWEGDGAQMKAFVAPLVAEGYRVVAFDMPAHGGSDGRQTHAVDMAKAIETVVSALGAAHAIIAHSLGGAAASLAIANGLYVNRLVLLAPAAEPTFFARRAAVMMGLPEAQHEGMLNLIEERLGHPLSTFDVRLLAPKQRTPLLVMHDPEDIEVPWSHGLGIAEAWPNARLERLTGLGHRRLLRDAQVIAQTVAFVDDAELSRSL